MGFTFDEMYNEIYGKWLLWTEIGICGVLPAILLIISKFRKIPFILYTAGILSCLGIVINRFVATVQNLAIPVLPFDKWHVYIPNWTEWATSLMVVSYAAIIISLSYRYLPVFPQEIKLNKAT